MVEAPLASVNQAVSYLVAVAETFDMFWIILSALAGLVALAAEGLLSADQVVWLLVLMVFVTAFASRAVAAVRALLAILAVYSLVTRYGGGDWRVQAGLIGQIVEIGLYLVAIWIMLRGLVPSTRR